MQVSFTIPGRIGGKGRPRATVRKSGGRTFASVYTPAKTASTEAMVRQIAAQAMRGTEILSGPISLCISIWLCIPDSWTKKRKAAADYVTGKPDVDNVIKLIGDALNGITWADDSQIAVLEVSRRYLRQGHERVEITITELTNANGEIAKLAEGQPRAADLDSAARGALPLFAGAAA